MSLQIKCGTADPTQVADAAFASLNALQTHSPAAQIMGAGALFVLVCERFGLPLGDAMSYVHNNLRANEHMPHYRAIRQYMLRELK